jgi:uncharacterized membrane protein YeiH
MNKKILALKIFAVLFFCFIGLWIGLALDMVFHVHVVFAILSTAFGGWFAEKKAFPYIDKNQV